MNLITCSNCGWKLVGEHYKHCPMCKKTLPRFCQMCGSPVLPRRKYCDYCSKLRAKRSIIIKNTVNAKLIDIHTKEWEVYKANVTTESKPLNTVMNTVLQHYKGCAICKGPVETYYMIVKPIDGGHVNENNMWPLCEKCFDILCNNDNPIIAVNYRLYKNTNEEIYLRVRQLLKLD